MTTSPTSCATKAFFITFILKKIMHIPSPCCSTTPPPEVNELQDRAQPAGQQRATVTEQPQPHTGLPSFIPPSRGNVAALYDSVPRRASQESIERPPSRTSIASAGPGSGSRDELETLAAAGRELRTNLEACKASGDYSRYGELVNIGGVAALKFKDDDEGIQNFRSLLAASKEAMGINGVAVLIRPKTGYPGSELFALEKDNFQTVGGVTHEGTAISICKGGGKMPNDTRFTDIMDVLYEVNYKRNGTPLHFACLSSIADLYNKKCGAETFGVVAKEAKDHTPGWGDEHTQHFKKAWDTFVFETEIDGKPTTINLPLVGMRINPQLRAEIKETGKALGKATQDSTDFSKLDVYAGAVDMYAAAQAKDKQEKQQKQAAQAEQVAA
ncbi:hypothetical protein Hsero_0820 [Herbaspirillum seropedicae SmR1]|uniref:Uncharacterized protein n=2 Tax=Herbaspirillum seropedicae TaxID=964 RepID=D8J002_HERSS|nr:hypothetical protein Hsero_0820 [Herbaspirillum seropedicae SmR1]